MLTSLLTSTISLLLGPQPLALGLDAHRLVQLPRARLPVCEIAAPEAAAASQQQLSAIPAAPDPSTASFDLAEQLSERGALPHGPWRHAFRAITTDHDFLHHGWAKQAFKLEESWPFAIGAYTMDDVARDVTLLPPGFVAHGVEANGGIFNKALSEGFTFADVDAAMDGATVVMLNAGVRHHPKAPPHKIGGIAYAQLRRARVLTRGCAARLRSFWCPNWRASRSRCSRLLVCRFGSTSTCPSLDSNARRSCTRTSRTCCSCSAPAGSGGACIAHRRPPTRRVTTRLRAAKAPTL